MMKAILIVEGPTDREFFKNILISSGKSSPDEIDIRPGYGKYEIYKIAKSYIRTHLYKIGIARDMDKGTPSTLEEQLRHEFSSANFSLQNEGIWYKVEKSRVLLIPMGLFGDQQLIDLGVKSFAHEDYLLKLLLSSLKSVDRLKSEIALRRERKIPLNKSKDILNVAVSLGLSPENYLDLLVEAPHPAHRDIIKPIDDKLEILKDP